MDKKELPGLAPHPLEVWRAIDTLASAMQDIAAAVEAASDTPAVSPYQGAHDALSILRDVRKTLRQLRGAISEDGPVGPDLKSGGPLG